MANRVLTEKILSRYKKHGNVVLEGMDEAMSQKAIEWKDIDFAAVLESDFGAGWQRRIKTADHDVVEAVITSGVFGKMLTRTVRHALLEPPKEEYVISNMITTETREECDGGFEDHGVLSNITAVPVCELEAGPLYGMAADSLVHPNGKSYAAGLAWTREALCADPNGYLLKQIPLLRDAHFEVKEQLLLDALVGYTPSYNRSGTLYNTYYEFGNGTPFQKNGPWVNASGDDIICSSDLQNLAEIFDDMRDIVTGKEIIVDTSSMDFITSPTNARSIRPMLLATEVRCDSACEPDESCQYIMTGDVARGGTNVNLVAYRRWVSTIMKRWNQTRANAEKWVWAGDINDFIGFVYQIAPEVTRCATGGEDCAKRIVARYSSLSKGYAYIKNPQTGVILTGNGSVSV